jgi:hypothetical protein
VPGVRASVREISACGSSNACGAIRADRPAGWSWPAGMATGGRRDGTLVRAARGSAVATRAEAGTPAWFMAVTGPGATGSEVTGEVFGPIVELSPLAIVGSIDAAAFAVSIGAESSALVGCESLLRALAAPGASAATVILGAASADSEARPAAASTAGTAPGLGTAAAGSTDAVSAAAGAAASTPGGCAEATRGGSRLSGST